MSRRIGILLFDGVEELDFAGPWEVFTSIRMVENDAPTVLAIAEHAGTVRCAKGLRVTADHSFADAPALDVLLVPGGQGTRREVDNAALIEWLRKTGEACEWVTSVCTCCTRPASRAASGSLRTGASSKSFASGAT